MSRILSQQILLAARSNESACKGEGAIVLPRQLLKFVCRVPITQNLEVMTDQQIQDMYREMEREMSEDEDGMEMDIEVDDLFGDVSGIGGEAVQLLARAEAQRTDGGRAASADREKARRMKEDEERRAKKEREEREFQERKREEARQRRIAQGRDPDGASDSDEETAAPKSRLMYVTVEFQGQGQGCAICAYDVRPDKRSFYDIRLPDEHMADLQRRMARGALTARERDAVIIDYVQDAMVLEQQGTSDMYLWKVKKDGGLLA
jgi:hypothetical protein